MAKGIEIDDRRLIKFRKDLKKLNNVEVRAGIVGRNADAKEHKSKNPPTNVQLGAIHEFGAEVKNGFGKGIHIIIPQRSFIRSTADENRGKYQKALVSGAIAVIKRNKNVVKVMRLLGERVKGDILKKIKNHISPALKEKTIKAKGGETTPLVDTGVLVGAISSEVRVKKKLESFVGAGFR